MSTRGCIGFRLHGKDYLVYNHSDSYPSWLGNEIAKFIVAGVTGPAGYDDFIGLTKQRVLSLVAVEEDAKPTEGQKKVLAEYTDLGVSSGNTDDWYCLLRDTHGDLDKMLAARYFIPYDDFMRSGLFCEHAYVINLDEETLEYYEGFEMWTKSKAKDKSKGRYWLLGPEKSELDRAKEKGYDGKPRGCYGPVVLKNTTKLSEITDADAYVKLIDPPEKEEAA
jgi:hypothetical protein